MDSTVIEQLRKSGAMLEGHFLLSSGLHSDRYFQCARLLQYPDRAALALADTVEKIKADIRNGSLKVDVVVGPAMGGIIVAYELGRQLGLPVMFTERDAENQMSLRRFEMEKGIRCLIAEDVVTTAKSSKECAAALEKLGAVVSGLFCIVDRSGGSISLPWPFYPAASMKAESWDPSVCELCKKGSPVVKPGSRKNIQ